MSRNKAKRRHTPKKSARGKAAAPAVAVNASATPKPGTRVKTIVAGAALVLMIAVVLGVLESVKAMMQ